MIPRDIYSASVDYEYVKRIRSLRLVTVHTEDTPGYLEFIRRPMTLSRLDESLNVLIGSQDRTEYVLDTCPMPDGYQSIDLA